MLDPGTDLFLAIIVELLTFHAESAASCAEHFEMHTMSFNHDHVPASLVSML